MCAVLNANAAVSPLVPTQKPGRFGSDPYAPFYADLKFRFPVVSEGGSAFSACLSLFDVQQASFSQFLGDSPPKSLTVERQPAVGLVAARAVIISSVPGVYNDLAGVPAEYSCIRFHHLLLLLRRSPSAEENEPVALACLLPLGPRVRRKYNINSEFSFYPTP